MLSSRGVILKLSESHMSIMLLNVGSAVGVVHAWVDQKLLKSNVLRVLFIAPKLQLKAYFTYSDT